MFVLGLTGSIAMGKTWGAKCFRHFGVPVHDADACVHDLLGPGGEAVVMVAAAFPGVMAAHGGIDRLKLAESVFSDLSALDTLEAMLHPLVRQSQRRFLAAQRRAAASLVVAGTAISVTVIAAGWLLSVAGEVICLVPNALGESLLYNERIR